MLRFLIVMLVTTLGCGDANMSAIPNATSDFVDNQNGVGTARYWGVDFEVQNTTSAATTVSTSAVSSDDPTKSASSVRFGLGDDVLIELNTVDKTDIEFKLNDQDYGVLHKNDKVVIDPDRNVTVNGEARLPNKAD